MLKTIKRIKNEETNVKKKDVEGSVENGIRFMGEKK